MTDFADEVAAHARDLLRSLWSELGAGDAPRRHDGLAIDIEPLIVFTAMYADARLREKTVHWCSANGRYLSLARLNRFARELGETTSRSFKKFAEAAAESAMQARTGHKPDLRRPALVQLRLRALVGVSARAEALKLLLAQPHQAKSAAAMARAAGYGKARLTQALDLLTVAGIVTACSQSRRNVYRLNRPDELAHALSGLPALFPDWPAIFAVVGAILEYSRAVAGETATRIGSAARAAERIREEIERIPGATPPPRVDDEASACAFEQWASGFVSDQAGARAETAGKREVVYTVHRLLVGGWIATIKDEGGEPRPLALSDDPELEPDRRARRRLKPDDVGAAADVVESIFYDIRTRELQRRRGSVVPRDAVLDSLLPALSREFAGELLAPMHKGQAETFTEEFLERWSKNRRNRLSAAG